MSFFSPSSRRLRFPSNGKPMLHNPNFAEMSDPRLSSRPLSASEIDYDDLVIHKTWRVYDEKDGSVRYFMYQLSQRNPGESIYTHFYKAVRLIRLTRVPRYLREVGNAGSGAVFEQQRDVLAALRQQNVLFLNIIAKSPELPLVFGYGVQAVADTIEEAQMRADESYAVLDAQLSGTYQQLLYSPLTVGEGESLARHQAQWNHIAIARGRPVPDGGSLGNAGLLDGNRTDVESVNNQLESFIRGMSNRSFMLSLVTVPLMPEEITLAWRNIAGKLSDVRSDQQGSRSVHAGVALPLTMGQSFGDSAGNSHGVSQVQSTGDSLGVSSSVADSTQHSTSHGQSSSLTDTASVGSSQSASVGHSNSATAGLSHSTTESETIGRTDNFATSVGVSQGESQSVSLTDGRSLTSTDGASQSVTVGESHGLTNTLSQSQTVGTSESSSLSQGSSLANNWTNSVGQSLGFNSGVSNGFNQSGTTGESQAISAGGSQGSSNQFGTSQGSSTGLNGGVPGFSGSNQDNTGSSQQVGNNQGTNWGNSLTGSNSNTLGVSSAQNFGQSAGQNWSEAVGGSIGQNATASNSVGVSNSFTVGQAVSTSETQSVAQTQGLSHSLAQGVSQSVGQTLGANQGVTQGFSQGQALSQGVGLSQGVSDSRTLGATDSATVTQGTSQGQSRAVSTGESVSTGDSVGRTVTGSQSAGTNSTQALSDAYQVAMARNAQQSGSLGVVPNLGVSISKQTYDEAKRYVGDILQAQMQRYGEGIESGAFLYQMFLTAPDRDTLLAGSGLLKSAFWGAGHPDKRLPQPFHTVERFAKDDELHNAEKGRLLTHAWAFTSYRKREPVSELIEPFLYSTYVTPGEAATFCHPPTSEATGLLAVHDSMPVFAQPSNRANRELYLGHIINGERACISDQRYGMDTRELTHMLVTGVTGTGKTTTLMRLLTELATVEREVTLRPNGVGGIVERKNAYASVLALDWMRNMRDLAQVVPADRFRFYSLVKPELGEFRWNLLEVPAQGMTAQEWLNAQADNFTAAFNLGDFGRSLIAEFLTDLYSANRLVENVLVPAVTDPLTGEVKRMAIVLPAIDPSELPADAILHGPEGDVANVFTYTPLSRLVGMSHLAALVVAKVEMMATPEGARHAGTAMRDRLQSLWRRLQYFAPGGQFASMLSCDTSLRTRTCLQVKDLVDPDRGLFTILETDGLDIPSRRLILGSVLLAVYRYGLYHGEGVFDQGGQGPGAWVVLEEAHELFGETARDEDATTVATRNAIYESMFRRCRALGMHLIAIAQNPASLPTAVTSNISTVVVHGLTDNDDRLRVASMLSWANTPIGGNLREIRFIGELPRGHAVVRMEPKTSWLEAAPVNVYMDNPDLAHVPDEALAQLARQR